MGPWVDELRKVCRDAMSSSPMLLLDLSALTFVDCAGAVLLADLVRGGAIIASRSNFVAELLQGSNT